MESLSEMMKIILKKAPKAYDAKQPEGRGIKSLTTVNNLLHVLNTHTHNPPTGF